jgi:alpha-N-arabinofuranosidase
VPYVDITATLDEAGEVVSFFAVNRNPSEAIEVEIALTGFGSGDIIDHQVMTHADLNKVNTAAEPNAVVPAKGTGASFADGKLKVTLAPYSYQMIRAKV